MNASLKRHSFLLFTITTAHLATPIAVYGDVSDTTKAYIDSTDWRALTSRDFCNVNCQQDTWTWEDSFVRCSGSPIGVIRSREQYTNFELVCSWRHLSSGGNSGIFVWASKDALADLEPGVLPRNGIEIQMLDHGYADAYEKERGEKADWFTTNGDVFAVGSSKFVPFAPTSPNGRRSFPRKNLSKGVNLWNHYYIRGINGEIRLWVNGEEVSGGNECDPRSGYICLESEGAPVEFKDLRIRELP